jgi:branched-chain amino acid transport system permease protein
LGELVASGLITGGVYALVALGLNLQYGLMRILNIAHGEFLMLGAFLTWCAQTSLGCRRCSMLPVSFALLMALGLVDPPADLPPPRRDLAEPRRVRGARPDGRFGLMFLVQNFAQWPGAATCAATTA